MGICRGWDPGPWGRGGWREPGQRLWCCPPRKCWYTLRVLFRRSPNYPHVKPSSHLLDKYKKASPEKSSRAARGQQKLVMSAQPFSRTVPVQSTGQWWATRKPNHSGSGSGGWLLNQLPEYYWEFLHSEASEVLDLLLKMNAMSCPTVPTNN